MKITQQEQQQGVELFEKLVQKSWDSTKFKQQLISNPVETIESVLGNKFNLPRNKKVIVEDQTDTEIIYLNIPRKTDYDNFELTDEELELVAGGILPLAVFLTYVAVGITIGGAAGLIINKL